MANRSLKRPCFSSHWRMRCTTGASLPSINGRSELSRPRPNNSGGLQAQTSSTSNLKEADMKKINLVRVLLGGLIAGLVLNIGEFLLNEAVLGNDMRANFA